MRKINIEEQAYAIVFHIVDFSYLIIFNRSRKYEIKKKEKTENKWNISSGWQTVVHFAFCILHFAFTFDALCQQQFNSIELNLTPLLECRQFLAGPRSSMQCSSATSHVLASELSLPICVICLPILKYSFTLIVNGRTLGPLPSVQCPVSESEP